MERGQEQGAARKQSEIVQRMKAKGMSDDEISELTGLSVEEIDTING
jgi:predicted transposase/invertase (TIGR01784 family)